MGMWLANAKDINIQQILHFKEHLTILLITGLFIFLAARISLDDFAALGSGALLLFVFMQLVSRPLSIFLSTMRSNLNVKDKLFCLGLHHAVLLLRRFLLCLRLS